MSKNIEDDTSNAITVQDSLPEKPSKTPIKEEKQISDKKEDISTEMSSKEQSPLLLPSYVKNYCKTGIESTTFDYFWEIREFKRIAETVDVLYSSTFPENNQYQIQMNFTHESHNSQDISVKLYLCTSTVHIGSCATVVMNSSEKVLLSNTISGRISDMTLLAEILNFSPFCKDVLIIQCKIEIFHKLINNTIYMNLVPCSEFSKNVKPFKDVNPILDVLEFKNGKAIRFTVGKENFVISKKLLLATNSSYFKDMCLDKSEKNMTSELNTSSELAAFREMLLFFITGSLKQRSYNMLKEVLKIAHKYDVQNLKLMCEHYLLCHITVKNAIELVQLALSCNAKFLETHSATFANYHIKEIQKSLEYCNLLVREDSSKIMELIQESEIFEYSTEYFSPSSDKIFLETNI